MTEPEGARVDLASVFRSFPPGRTPAPCELRDDGEFHGHHRRLGLSGILAGTYSKGIANGRFWNGTPQQAVIKRGPDFIAAGAGRRQYQYGPRSFRSAPSADGDTAPPIRTPSLPIGVSPPAKTAKPSTKYGVLFRNLFSMAHLEVSESAWHRDLFGGAAAGFGPFAACAKRLLQLEAAIHRNLE